MKINNLSLIQHLFMAIVSGAMIIPLATLDILNDTQFYDVSLTNIFIGVAFGLFVMIPFQKRLNVMKIILMLIASTIIYNFVVRLAISHYQLFYLKLDYSIGIIISGALGAFLTGITTQLLAPLKFRKYTYIILVIVGAIAGFVFSHTINSNQVYIVSIGYIMWQVMVCFVMFSFEMKSTKRIFR